MSFMIPAALLPILDPCWIAESLWTAVLRLWAAVHVRTCLADGHVWRGPLQMPQSWPSLHCLSRGARATEKTPPLTEPTSSEQIPYSLSQPFEIETDVGCRNRGMVSYLSAFSS